MRDYWLINRAKEILNPEIEVEIKEWKNNMEEKCSITGYANCLCPFCRKEQSHEEENGKEEK